MKLKPFSLLFLSLFFGSRLFAQSAVSVNPLTGSADVNIPVYTVTRGQVVFPISIQYAGSGVKPSDAEGNAGLGWNLQAGGQVTRQVRGLPDDCTQDLAATPVYGWMSTLDTAANMIAGFSIANNGSNCTYETSDISYINAHFPYRDDTEPDLFYVNAPGLSCQLVYNRADGKFHPVNYADLEISFTTDAYFKLITSFTIINNRGIKYVFAARDTTVKSTNGPKHNFMATQYNQYKNGVFYFSAWSLTSMTDANGNGVSLDYTNSPMQISGADSVDVYIAGASKDTLEYYVKQGTKQQLVTDVKSTDGDIVSTLLNFTWDFGGHSGNGINQNMVAGITGLGINLQFGYDAVPFIKSDGSEYLRNFLTGFDDDSGTGNSPYHYQFDYYGEYGSGVLYTYLPDSTSKQLDYWGYYSANGNTSILPKIWVNPSNSSYQRYMVYQQSSESGNYPYALPGNAMTVDSVNIIAGSLRKITYTNGSSTTIVYESNSYLDPLTNTSVKGGGIRVKQTIDSVGAGTANNIIRNYSYTNPSTHLSSGKPLSLPQFAFTIPYSGSATGLSLWEYSTAISKSDLSAEDNTIMYEYSKMSQTGAGSTQYHYYIPAANWDNTAHAGCSGCTTTDWQPTIDYAARTNCSLTYGQIKNITWSYPFTPNKNYDFERGLPLQVISYNDAGSEVSETDYTYQRSFAPDSMVAFRFDDNIVGSLDVKAYNKYTVYYGASELTATVYKKVFDSNSPGLAQSGTTTYTYGSGYHKLPTQTQLVNSDGSTLISKISYVKDFPITAPDTNAYRNGLYHLQQQNINVPVESYTEVTAGGTTLVTGGSLLLFKADAAAITGLPAKQLKFVQPDGLPSTGAGAFTPFSAGTHVPSYDSHYYTTQNFTTYDLSNYLVTSDDNHHHITTTLIDHITYKPTAVFSNAAANQVVFNDFDSQASIWPMFSFTGSGSFPANGSHTGKAYGFATTQTATSSSITKNTLAANYIFSIWINAPAGSNTLHIALNGGTAVAYPYTATGAWKYYEWKIPVGSMPSTFTVSFTSSQNISMDDILFYPEVAEVNTYAYNDTTFAKTAQTNTNGISTYFANDSWGRNLFTYDRDHNIIQKHTYVTADQVLTFNSITGSQISVTGTRQQLSPLSFKAPVISINSEARATWNFGDDTTHTVVNAWSTVSHTYSAAGTYTVTLTLSSPYFGTKTVSTPVTIAPKPITISYANNTTGNAAILSVVFTPTNGGTAITVSGSSLNGYQLPKNMYNIGVNMHGSMKYPYPTGGTGGYTCLDISGECVALCSNYIASNSYSYNSVDLTDCSTLTFTVSTFDCSHFNPPAQ